ncbi:MAG: UDP-N-acetylglucosamine 1-carboxyvinyltransferase [Firmicutes bacterium]|nr:UDP-N-acetylglucosamine 1-carboxyvinyltransferase [Bacillota bacterium]
MAIFEVESGAPLMGEAVVHPAKNAVLPIIAASLLTKDTILVPEMPDLSDVRALCGLVQECGGVCQRQGAGMALSTPEPTLPEASHMMRWTRASVLIMGPLLARLGSARITMPGGCAIGQRPIDLHLKGMAALGAEIVTRQGFVELKGRLHGGVIYLDLPSVGATENIMMAAVLAEGVTRIENAAKEPEIADLAQCLNAMGAQVQGAGSGSIVIRGVRSLHGATHQPIPDRIEAGTFCCAVAVAGGNILVRGARPEHMRALLFKLQEAGMSISEFPGGLRVRGKAQWPMEIRTLSYPGFPTDLQAPMMIVACIAQGTSVFLETIFENRFMHIPELLRMGANIRVEDHVAVIEGGYPLQGASVSCPDLRSGAALILAGLAAEGVTRVEDPQGHIDRGYENFEHALTAMGAQVRRL